MPTIPKYTTQVNPATQNIPTVPTPGVVRGAFGENVAQANQNIGKSIGNMAEALQKHVEERNKQKMDAWIADNDTNFRLAQQNLLLSDQQEKVKVNGKDVTRPAGLLNQNFEQADGASLRYDDWYRKTKEQYLKAAPNPQVAQEISKKLDAGYVSGRELVFKHEAKQSQMSLVKSQVSNLDQQIHDAAAITDPKLLGVAVLNAMKTQENISAIKGDDPQTLDKLRKDKAGDIVSNAAYATLVKTNDLEQAKLMVQSAEGNVNPDRTIQINDYLEKKYEQMNRVNKAKIELAHDTVKADLQDKLLTDQLSEIDLENAARIPPEQGGLKPTEIETLKKGLYVSRDKQINTLKKENSQAEKYIDIVNKFSDNTADSFKAKDMIIKAYSDGVLDKSEANELNKLKSLLKDAAWNKKDNLFVQSVNGIKSFFGSKNEDTPKISMAIHNLVNRVNDGEHPAQAIINIKNQERLTKYPWMATLPIEGAVRVLKDGTKVKCFPNGDVQEVK